MIVVYHHVRCNHTQGPYHNPKPLRYPGCDVGARFNDNSTLKLTLGFRVLGTKR